MNIIINYQINQINKVNRYTELIDDLSKSSITPQ